MDQISQSVSDLVDQFAVDVGQAAVDAVVAIREPLVIDTQQVQHGGVQIAHMHDIFHGVVAKLVGRAIGRTAFDAPAGEPHAERIRMMVMPLYHIALIERYAASERGS